MDPFTPGLSLAVPPSPLYLQDMVLNLAYLSRTPSAPSFGSALSHHVGISFSLPKLL